MNNLDSKMKILKENLTTNNEGNQNYRKCKCDLNYIYDQSGQKLSH